MYYKVRYKPNRNHYMHYKPTREWPFHQPTIWVSQFYYKSVADFMELNEIIHGDSPFLIERAELIPHTKAFPKEGVMSLKRLSENEIERVG